MWKILRTRLMASRAVSGALVTLMMLAVGIAVASIAVGFAKGAALELNKTAASQLNGALAELAK
ncbi:MAG: hypothetical protein ABH829_04050 [archaeon]